MASPAFAPIWTAGTFFWTDARLEPPAMRRAETRVRSVVDRHVRRYDAAAMTGAATA